jgi:hypothetical protein
MISENQASRPIESMTQRLARLVFVELPPAQLLALAAAVGSVWAASLFDRSFVTGGSAFWQFPKGTINGSEYDMAQVLVGYLYFVQSPWHLPLFHISTLGAPAGTNVIFMDVVPIVALAGKLIHSFTGTTVNLYGTYSFLCFSLPGVMITLVLIAAKTRYALAVIIGAIFANAMPALLFQWGHIALGAHFSLIGALALYLFSLQQRAWRGLTGTWVAYLALAYLTNLYLFTMVGTVWLCAVIQRQLDGLPTRRELFRVGLLMVAAVASVIALSGQFGSGGGLPFDRYGIFSMNLMSPFAPQESGLLPRLGGVIDATHGQYEGFNYLGIGLLFATLLVLPSEIRWIRQNLRRHIALFVALVLLTAFAVSNRVFIGHWLLFEIPLPHLNRVLGIFRSSGRFFWLVGYAQIALVLVLGFQRARPLTALCLAAAAILQLFDVQPLRAQIIASIAAAPSAARLDDSQVAHLIRGARDLEVIPSFQCSINAKQWQANMELMLATARANIPTNSVDLARESYSLGLRELLRAPSRYDEMLRASRIAYCEQEVEQAQRGGRPGEILVLLADQISQRQLMPDVVCSSFSWARYCKRQQ